ncbi:MAG: NAD(+)/NADH kinase [Candidatus Woesearchaeota archaeon]
MINLNTKINNTKINNTIIKLNNKKQLKNPSKKNFENILLVYQENSLFLSEVLNFLKSKTNCLCIERDFLKEEHYNNINLIVVLGGDGTFLRASHLNKNIPMIGINPNPEKKEGFYMKATIQDYKEKIEKILFGKINIDYKIIKLLRLGVKINNKKLPQYVLNEVFIGDKKPYNVFNYILKIQKKEKSDDKEKIIEEFQRSSGLLIGTPSGSNAWLSSAGGLKQNLEDKQFQYIARELYEGRLTKNYKLKQGFLESNPHNKVLFIPKSKGILVIDSISPEYELNINDEIDVFTDEYLNYIIF